MPLTDTPIQRAMSPTPGRSTLMTSAPWSASSAAAYGPVNAMDRSSTRTPFIGPFMLGAPSVGAPTVPGRTRRRLVPSVVGGCLAEADGRFPDVEDVA